MGEGSRDTLFGLSQLSQETPGTCVFSIRDVFTREFEAAAGTGLSMFIGFQPRFPGTFPSWLQD